MVTFVPTTAVRALAAPAAAMRLLGALLRLRMLLLLLRLGLLRTGILLIASTTAAELTSAAALLLRLGLRLIARLLLLHLLRRLVVLLLWRLITLLLLCLHSLGRHGAVHARAVCGIAELASAAIIVVRGHRRPFHGRHGGASVIERGKVAAIGAGGFHMARLHGSSAEAAFAGGI